MSEWKTIDTAPRDGTKILAICASAYSPEANVAWWSDGWWSYRYEPEEKFCQPLRYWFPTHWQPLPQPPSKEDD